MHRNECLTLFVNQLGHTEVAPFEGLNVDLLQFQRQSVQWALERETVQGGIESLLWPKLPAVADGKDIYYNPILDEVRYDKPRLVRGGMIASEMGTSSYLIASCKCF